MMRCAILLCLLLLPTTVLAQGVGELEPWLENDPSPTLSANLTVGGYDFTGMGNITGTDVDISAGTGSYSSTGPISIAADGVKFS